MYVSVMYVNSPENLDIGPKNKLVVINICMYE